VEAASAATSTIRDRGGGGGGAGVRLSRHVSFLAGVLSLDSAAAGERTCPTTHVVAPTAQLVLDAVLRHHDDDDGVISHSAAVHAVSVVARVCDVAGPTLCDVVRQFVRYVVASIINNQQLNQVPM